MNEINKELLSQIISYINNNDLKNAELNANDLLTKYPNSDVVNNLIGNIEIKKNNFKTAIKFFNKALKINPNFISAILNMGVAYQNLNNNTKALKYFKDVIKIKPNFFAAYNNIGYLYNELGEYSNAILQLKKAIELNPNYAEAYLNIAIAYHKLEKFSDAIVSYKNALKFKEELYVAHFNLGEIYRKLDNFSDALPHYHKSRNEKTYSRILECLLALNLKNEFEESIEYLSKKNSDDRRIAAVSAYISNQFKSLNKYPFCPEPLKFVYKNNLNKFFSKFNNFLKDLFEEITHQDFTWEPAARTTVKGYATKGNLSELKLSKLSYLEKILKNEINQYRIHYKNEKCNFIKNWPKKYKFIIWSNRIKSEGHNIPHIHPSGWLSGVFYLKIPSQIKDNEAGIEFSLHGDNYKIIDENIPSKNILPLIGDLVLFPSSLFHKTIPFKSKEERVCIAFDIVKIQ